MKRRFVLILLSFSVLISAFAIPIHALPNSISVSAKAAALIDGSSGEVFYEKNAHERLGMASTTKIMTALVVAEEAEIDKVVKIPKAAVGIEGSSVYLTEGETLTVRQLLYALLLSSANDAAVALAICVSGSVEAFVELMNRRAQDMGLEDTHFTNPHGLYDEAHYTTAYELALISAEALNNPLIREIASTYKTTIPKGEAENGRFLLNHNKMLRLYDGAIGLKTGFTKKTGRCLVSAAERDGLMLIAVSLNAPDDWNDHCAMLDLGFDNYESVTLYETGEFRYPLPITNGKEQYVIISNPQDITLTLPKVRSELRCQIKTLGRFEFAPIKQGTALGELVCEVGERSVKSSLVAAYDVEPTPTKKGFLAKILDFFLSLFS